MATSESAATAANPSPLPSRYEIRRIPVSQEQWVSGILAHSNVYHNPVFSTAYPVKRGARFNQSVRGCTYLAEHQLLSGLSYGVYDLKYEYRTEEARAAGGKFYFDGDNDDLDSEAALASMDFPLVCIALSYDQDNKVDMSKMGDLVAALPCFGNIYAELSARDTRKSEDWEATGPGQVAMRNGTSTRRDYESKGIMKGLSHWYMQELALKGYRGIQMEAVNAAVSHVWLNPPPPIKSTLVSTFNTKDAKKEKDTDGKEVNPFGDVDYKVDKFYLAL